MCYLLDTFYSILDWCVCVVGMNLTEREFITQLEITVSCLERYCKMAYILHGIFVAYSVAMEFILMLKPTMF